MNSVNAKIFDVIQEYADRRFQYGESDCCQFVSDCVAAVCGTRHADFFNYQSESEAYEIIDAHGGLHNLLCELFGQPGEVTEYGVALTTRTGRTMAGFIYKNRLCVRTENGVTDWPVEFANEVWSCHPQ